MAYQVREFLDDTWGIVRDTNRLIAEYGWYKGDFFWRWVGERIAARVGNPDATLNDVHNQTDQKGFRQLYFVGTDLSTRSRTPTGWWTPSWSRRATSTSTATTGSAPSTSTRSGWKRPTSA